MQKMESFLNKIYETHIKQSREDRNVAQWTIDKLKADLCQFQAHVSSVVPPNSKARLLPRIVDVVSSGSKRKGLDLPDSDWDLLLVLETKPLATSDETLKHLKAFIKCFLASKRVTTAKFTTTWVSVALEDYFGCDFDLLPAYQSSPGKFQVPDGWNNWNGSHYNEEVERAKKCPRLLFQLQLLREVAEVSSRRRRMEGEILCSANARGRIYRTPEA